MASFTAPPGLPVTLFAKIKAPGQTTGDLQISGNEIRLKNSSNAWTKFEHIYDQQSREKDIFDSDLQRVIPLMMDGYCVSIFVFGAFSSDKREILSGMIELLFGELWNTLSNKTATFEVQLNALEIVEDAMYDLIDLKNNHLVIEHTAQGPSVLNLQSPALSSTNDFCMLFAEIMDNRTQQLTEFGPKASKASFFLSLDVNHNDIHSKLDFVELPAADKLIENPTQLRMREGATLNKELIGISNLIRSLSCARDSPYSDCKTNRLLEDIFGGNCVSFGIICFDVSSSAEVNECLLQYAQQLSRIENYPVVNNDRMRGLLVKYCTRYDAVVRQLEALKKESQQNVDQEVDVIELRTLLMEKEREVMTLYGDKDKLRESYGEFRTKYSELVQRNNALHSELIVSEEKCLNLSKTLIDFEIEKNDFAKNESQIRAELETKLIGAENDILETGMREQKLAEEIAQLRKQTEELLAEKQTLSIEYVALRANYMNLNEECDCTAEEQEHLNVQLINLINANKALEESAARLRQENEILIAKNDELTTNKEALSCKYGDHQSEMLRLKTVSDKQSIELVKYEVEITRMKTAMDANKTEYEKKWLKICKEKEIELQNVTNQRSNESQHNKAQTQQLEREVETLKGQVRVANRQIANAQEKCSEYEQQMATLNGDCDKFRDSLAMQTDEFRSKLLQYLQRVNCCNIEDLKVTQQKLYQELVATHGVREEELMNESEAERKKNRKLHQQVQALNQRLLHLEDFVKDVAPDTTVPLSSNVIDVAGSTNELVQEEERLRHKMNALERELDKEKRAHVNTAERAQTQQEGIQRELLSLKKVLKEEHSNCDPMSHQIKIEYQENMKKLKTLQSTLQQQIEYNQSTQNKMEEMHSMQTDNAQQKTKMLESEVGSLQKKNKELKRQVQLSQTKTQGTMDTQHHMKQVQSLKKKYKENEAKYKRKIQELKGKMSVLEANSVRNQNGGGGDAWETVSKLEKEKAQLISKITALEAEYKAMEAHYRKEIQKYKKYKK
eukprot:629096_1